MNQPTNTQRLRPTEVVIDGRLFLVSKLPPREALAAAADLIKLIGPSIAALASGGKDASEAERNASTAQAMQLAFAQMDGQVLNRWIDRLVNGTTIAIDNGNGGMPLPNYERDALEFDTLLELLYHVGRVNLADPLARLLTRTGLDLGRLVPARLVDSATT